MTITVTTGWTDEQQKNLMKLTSKFIGLGIDAKPDTIEEGPVVTGYFFTLANSESVAKVTKKHEDLAFSLGADKVVVQRIKDRIVVFVPNEERKVVDFKDVLHWYLTDTEVGKAYLPIALGVDFHGKKSFIDLAECPHILLTGSTGSGKSVFEASIIADFAYKFSPDDLQLYLVDTKQVDLPLFKQLPHVKVMADTLEAYHNMMHLVMPEVRRRLGVLATAGVRKISEYHNMMGSSAGMPYLILIMDEIGDLIDQDKLERKADKEAYEGVPTVQQWIKQVVQIGRAAGVHIIAGTQRASVKIIDGDIKTNLPCRISLRVATQTDSRVILDQSGAENLLGKGDMLIKYPENDVLQRFHGPFVSMNDIQSLIMNYDMIRNSMKSFSGTVASSKNTSYKM